MMAAKPRIPTAIPAFAPEVIPCFSGGVAVELKSVGVDVGVLCEELEATVEAGLEVPVEMVDLVEAVELLEAGPT